MEMMMMMPRRLPLATSIAPGGDATNAGENSELQKYHISHINLSNFAMKTSIKEY